MNTLTRLVCPSATTQIRVDHAHVLTSFHQYTPDSAPQTKRLLVNNVCRALDIHAHLEEEIFYPAVYALDPALVDKNVPEHAEMKGIIADLQHMSPTHPEYDAAFLTLMRGVMRHVADEETILLPQVERSMGSAALDELGRRMTSRRLELTAGHLGGMSADALTALPTALLTGAAVTLVAGTYIVRHAFRR